MVYSTREFYDKEEVTFGKLIGHMGKNKTYMLRTWSDRQDVVPQRSQRCGNSSKICQTH